MSEIKITDAIKNKLLYFDGGMGSILISRGLDPSENSAEWNVSHPDVILSVHRDYIAAGADIITANTFSAGPLRSDDYSILINAGIELAGKAADAVERDIYIALDIGPCGKMLRPYGDLDFEDAVNIYKAIINAADLSKVDLVLLETFGECLETKAAVIAVKESCDLPLFVSNTYDGQCRMLTGTPPEAMAAMLEGLRVDAIGCNCSVGPAQMAETVRRLVDATSLPVFANPNAGLPGQDSDGNFIYDMSADEFTDHTTGYVKLGVSALGGCCGTTPEYIVKTVSKTAGMKPIKRKIKRSAVISSWAKCVSIGEKPLIIGERINPTGKPKLKDALRRGDIGYLINEAVSQQDAGAHVLDINVGLPEISEPEIIKEAVERIQAITELPLQIDTVDPAALEKALRAYAGKPLINSVNGKESSMSEVFPLAAKYGGAIIALTLDENGIPSSARERADIAAKIVKEAEKYGIGRENIIVDPLALTVSSDSNSARITIDTIDLIKKELGVAVSLGVSNISFGLPNREWVNSVFYAEALEHGLDLAIINPLSVEMMKTYRTHMMLHGLDPACADYIAYASSHGIVQSVTSSETPKKTKEENDGKKVSLENAVIAGMKERSAEAARELLGLFAPTEIIRNNIIPALNTVGKSFEEKKIFLPQLLMSAEAATAAFEEVKSVMPDGESGKGDFIIATVHGDLHDIGKNIVKTMLQSYGFNVIDLGKDVLPEKVLEAVKTNNVKIVGLSALMTTTVPSMQETIELLKKEVPDVYVIVGGAVLTQETAEMIGADAYSEDAMETVKLAEKYYGC